MDVDPDAAAASRREARDGHRPGIGGRERGRRREHAPRVNGRSRRADGATGDVTLDARPLGTLSFLKDWEPTVSKEVTKALMLLDAATPSAKKDKAHLAQLGLSDDAFPRQRMTLVWKLREEKNKIAALERNGIAGVEPGKKRARSLFRVTADVRTAPCTFILHSFHASRFIHRHMVSTGGHFWTCLRPIRFNSAARSRCSWRRI